MHRVWRSDLVNRKPKHSLFYSRFRRQYTLWSYEMTTKYQELLGQRGHFLFHSTFAILSYIIFGLVTPVTYGFAFHDSDDKDYKMLAVAAAGFGCIFVLTIAKAYVKGIDRFGGYVKTILYYVTMAVSASGVAYATGDLFGKLLDDLGWFQPAQVDASRVSSWASY
ncbi:hypothetical protein SASPL_144796 [Salvia splendens]|uniref:Uncharacterized protein n=1 Tax=Salvia splendens TaxID=180675 RepID=A0A8X8WFH4_SALSN|nr:hypothetical protein SASPL_144796 [Salvia splendens]